MSCHEAQLSGFEAGVAHVDHEMFRFVQVKADLDLMMLPAARMPDSVSDQLAGDQQGVAHRPLGISDFDQCVTNR